MKRNGLARKSLGLVALLAQIAVGIPAYAQTVTEEAANGASLGNRSVDSAAASETSPNESPGANAATIQSAVDNPKTPQTFSVSFLSFTDTDVASIYKDSSSTAYSRATLKYNLNDSAAIAVRQEIISSYATGGQAARSAVSDTRVGYVDVSLLKLPGDWTVSGAAYYYLPTGEKQRFENKRKGIILPLAAIGKSIGKWDIEYTLAPYLFINSQDSYQKDGADIANPSYEVDQWGSVAYNFTEYLNVNYALGSYNLWFRPKPGQGNTIGQNMYHEIGLTVKPTKQISFTASVDNEPNIWDSPKPFQLFRDEETVYRALLSVSL